MNISIHTRDPHLIQEIFQRSAPEPGALAAPAEGVTFSLQRRHHPPSLTSLVPEILEVVVELGGAIAVGVLANWICSRLQNRRIERVTVQRVVIETQSADEVHRVITEVYEAERR